MMKTRMGSQGSKNVSLKVHLGAPETNYAAHISFIGSSTFSKPAHFERELQNNPAMLMTNCHKIPDFHVKKVFIPVSIIHYFLEIYLDLVAAEFGMGPGIGRLSYKMQLEGLIASIIDWAFSVLWVGALDGVDFHDFSSSLVFMYLLASLASVTLDMLCSRTSIPRCVIGMTTTKY